MPSRYLRFDVPDGNVMDIGVSAMNHKRCIKPAGQSGKGYRIVSGLSVDILNRNLAATDPQVYPILVRRIVLG